MFDYDFDDVPDIAALFGPTTDADCERCGTQSGVHLEPSRTCYSVDPRTRVQLILDEHPRDPNADLALCKECAREHHEFWDDQWNEYYASLM